ncbi:MAG TPA: tRNA epoxyqueuosine(34) reductase QueG [Kofleriaceae bacterium]|jgi:epoxyqueuosine reductase|nr:tRNA epoxyqueuosine(34) reductase QueG [Kofleriaceae bacterium]
MTAATGAALIAELGRELGFARAAVVPIEPPRRHALYQSWLADGHAGTMAYLAAPDHVAPRGDLRALLATARSLIVVALAYDRADPIPPDALLRGKIARYARGEDYHLVMRDRLVALADRIAAVLGRPVASRPCVDSAPVLEREWAERAGIGFVAKNTMVIAPGLGSYVVLGELLVDAELAPTVPSEPLRPRCGACRSCLDACPTRAFVDAYVLDARRCISYLTIEHRGAIPRELRPAIGTWVFGCDVCQEVCPFNAGSGAAAAAAVDAGLRPRSLDHALPDLVALAAKGAHQVRRMIKRTALRRVSHEALLRNVAVALGNTGDPRAIPALVGLLGHRSAMVRGHAVWALGALGAVDELAGHADSDPAVADELTWARQAAQAARTAETPRTPPPPGSAHR